MIGVAMFTVAGLGSLAIREYAPSWMLTDIDSQIYPVYASEGEEIITASVIKTYNEPKVVSVEDKLNERLQGALTNHGDSFVRYGEAYDVDPVLLAAISVWETGNGSSKAAKQLKNAGGIMANANKGILKSFISINSSIEYMAWLLRGSYLDKRNVHSIKDIGNIYCPVGANNDPTGLNNHWIGGVTRVYKNLSDTEYIGGN
jgi:hypothetical protein